MKKTVLVTGAGGYVGAVLVPKLLNAGFNVIAYDLYIYGQDKLKGSAGNPGLKIVKGDIRDTEKLKSELKGVEALIHLACISNDPSYELNPSLGKSINFDCFEPMVEAAKEMNVRRFIYASSSSVYGVKSDPEVTEELELEPLTDYSKFKAACEEILLKNCGQMTSLIIRPATVCGYSPRLRLDLTVNILTNHAINKGEILVFGGQQKRPNIHIEDMTDLYVKSLAYPHEKIHRKIFNAGYENHTVDDIAAMVRRNIGETVKIRHESTNDNRSYHVSSKKIAKELGFVPKHSIEDAVLDLKRAFEAGEIPNSMTDDSYYNIKRMQKIDLK